MHADMLIQVCLFYTAGIPSYRTLRAHEIRFFYEGIRPQLCELTRPKAKPKK